MSSYGRRVQRGPVGALLQATGPVLSGGRPLEAICRDAKDGKKGPVVVRCSKPSPNLRLSVINI